MAAKENETNKDRKKDELEGGKAPEKKSDSKPPEKKSSGKRDGKKPDPKSDKKKPGAKQPKKPQSLVAVVQAILNAAKGISPDGLTMTGEPLEKVEINPPIDSMKVEAFAGPVTSRAFQQKNPDGTQTVKDPTPPPPPQNGGTSFQNTEKTTINFKRRPGGLTSSAGAPTNSME